MGVTRLSSDVDHSFIIYITWKLVKSIDYGLLTLSIFVYHVNRLVWLFSLILVVY